MIKSWLLNLTILGYEEVHVPELTPKSFETDEVCFAVNVHVWCAVWHGCFYGDTRICRPNFNIGSHFPGWYKVHNRNRYNGKQVLKNQLLIFL